MIYNSIFYNNLMIYNHPFISHIAIFYNNLMIYDHLMI